LRQITQPLGTKKLLGLVDGDQDGGRARAFPACDAARQRSADELGE
jgi:hypothetical protein